MAVISKLPNKKIIGLFAGAIDFYLYMGQIPVARMWPKYTWPGTPKQKKRGQVFATAVYLWQNMAEVDKQFYRELAYSTNMTGYEFFISLYLRTH